MKLTIVLPTYNNERTLYECLRSIDEQSLSKKDYELLVIDGGSTDKTLDIVKKFKHATLINNPKKVEDYARILGLSMAKGEIFGLIDADNVLLGKDWLEKALKPFKDSEIFSVDSLYFGYRKKDAMKVRYQALIGGDDPLATYLGFYSRWCYFKDDWTDFPYTKEQKNGYMKIKLTDPALVPTIGSNGFLIRTEIMRKYNYFVHPDYICEMVKDGYRTFAKIDAEIVHNQPTFFKNKIRRIKRRMGEKVYMNYNYGLTKWKILKTLLRIITILPMSYDVIKGFARKPDSAWLFHYPACLGLVFIHGYYKILGIFGVKYKFF